MNAKMFTVVVLSGILGFGVISASAAEGTAKVVEGRNVASADYSAARNANAAIDLQIVANSRSHK